MKWLKLFFKWRDARVIKEYDAAGPSLIVRPTWRDFLAVERARDAAWRADYSKLDQSGREAVERLLGAQISAAEGMRRGR